MKNKKGFTLVELLAVVVILALVMSIAVISIGLVLEKTRESTYKSTAATLLDGVRKRLLLANKLGEGDYEFTISLLEKGGENSPFGGAIQYLPNTLQCSDDNKVDDNICKVSTRECTATATSFVRVTSVDSSYRYSICLTAGANNKYIYLATESSLLDATDNSMFKDS